MYRAFFGILFILLALFTMGCTSVDEPAINRTEASPSERVTHFRRTVWFPIPRSNEEGKDTENPNLEAALKKASEWLEENEPRISSFSLDVVNSTIVDKGKQTSYVIPSGIVIAFTVKPGQ